MNQCPSSSTGMEVLQLQGFGGVIGSFTFEDAVFWERTWVTSVSEDWDLSLQGDEVWSLHV